MSAIWKRPDGTVIETEKQFITELNSLLARAEKAEAALESAQKMVGHWEKKATEHQQQFEECRTLLGERIESLREPLDEWKTIAEKAVAERDELKRKLSEARVKEHWEANEVERQLLRRAEAAEAKLKLQSGLCNTLPVVTNVPIDWQRVRIDAAIAAMQGLFAGKAVLMGPMDVIAVECANALVAELQKKEVEK